MLQILIVDDHADIRRLLTVTLSNEFTVQEAWNAETALDVVRRLHPRLVIIDLMLGGTMNAFYLVESIKSNTATKDILVVTLTDRLQESDQKKADTLGADAYFVKPFNPVQFRNWIKNHLK